MRQIKFRAWDKRSNQMVDDYAANSLSNGGIYVASFYSKSSVFMGEFELMQYTGLKDKNGKEIYEGDIVRFHYFYAGVGENLGFEEREHSLIGVITWCAFGWGVSAIQGEHWEGYTGYAAGEGEANIMELYAMNSSGIHEESFEVLGNIYENPELLTQKQ